MATTVDLSLFFICILTLLQISLQTNTYNTGDKVEVYVNKVGPYFNPQETYHYYQLPVCRPDKVIHKSLTLGEVLDGDRMALSMYNIKFKEDKDNEELCTVDLNNEQLDQLRNAIEELYYFEFVIDELPVRGFIGHLEEGGWVPHHHKISLWTHIKFVIKYNGNQVIAAEISTKDRSPSSLDDVTAPYNVKFLYSVVWEETTVKFADRVKLTARNFFPKTLEIHWLSIINSMVLVFLLLGFVIIILTRVLKNDFARYNSGDDVEELDGEDNGWKIIHTDVFRFPQHKSVFCSLLGVGCQFLALATGIIIMALFDMFNVHKHGHMNTAACLLYALTSGVAGYVSSHMFRQLGGRQWVRNILLTCVLFSAPFFLVWSVLNTVAITYHSTQALPAPTIILLLSIWLVIGVPLTVAGGILGKNFADDFDAPCRTKNICREIPPVPWYRSAPAHMVIGGFLPFSAISVELYYIFSTVWGRDQYTLYGILLVVFIILLSVTACISVALTYFQLSAEDYRWWWRSVCSAGSTGMFVLLYGTFYYYKRSNMSGLLQSVEFFGYTLLACYVFFLMLGSLAFFASLSFVRYIYKNIKMD